MSTSFEHMIWMDGGDFLGEDVCLVVRGDHTAAQEAVMYPVDISHPAEPQTVDNLQVFMFQNKKTVDITPVLNSDQEEAIGEHILAEHYS